VSARLVKSSATKAAINRRTPKIPICLFAGAPFLSGGKIFPKKLTSPALGGRRQFYQGIPWEFTSLIVSRFSLSPNEPSRARQELAKMDICSV
jgi:hypothetical protein